MGFYSNLSVTIIEAYESGMNIEHIAKKLDLSLDEVKSVLDAYLEDDE